jgi:hypothetical protein
MSKGFAAWTIGVVAAFIMCSPLSRGQTAQVKASSGTESVPRHDISGTWTPARGEGDGIGGQGARDMPEDGKPEHQLLYTPLAREKMKNYRPGNGARQNVPSQINDPAVIYCDPQGMPRQDLYELRTTQIPTDSSKGGAPVRIFENMAGDLGRWPRTPQRSGTAVVRLLGGQMGG